MARAGRTKLLEDMEVVWEKYGNDIKLYEYLRACMVKCSCEELLDAKHWIKGDYESSKTRSWMLTILGLLLTVMGESFKQETGWVYYIVVLIQLALIVGYAIIMYKSALVIKKESYLVDVIDDEMSSRETKIRNKGE